MQSEESLVKKFARRGTVVGGELFLDIQTALDFVAACQSNNLAVIGVEGFILKPDGLLPQQDMIADYSSAQEPTWDTFRDLCNHSAGQFLKAISPMRDLAFSFVVKGKDHEAKK